MVTRLWSASYSKAYFVTEPRLKEFCSSLEKLVDELSFKLILSAIKHFSRRDVKVSWNEYSTVAYYSLFELPVSKLSRYFEDFLPGCAATLYIFYTYW